MKRVLFIVGPALGHVGRSLVIARALAKIPGHQIHFAGVSPGHAEQIVKGEFPVYTVPFGRPGDEKFANGLESVVDRVIPDVICLDLSPVPWLTRVRFPRVTQAYITNFFLTQPFGYSTFQDEWFESAGTRFDDLRRSRGLPPVAAVKSLYERDAVILADPPAMVKPKSILPDNFHVVGPCGWEPESALSEELALLNDCLFVSLGSTAKELPATLVDRLSQAVGATTAVWVGKRPQGGVYESSGLNHFVCSWAPATEILARSRFVITQGGAGSTYQAIAAGLPVAVWPGHRNQWVLGEILQEIGVGFVLSEKFEVKDLSQNALTKLQRASGRYSVDCDDGPQRAAEILHVL